MNIINSKFENEEWSNNINLEYKSMKENDAMDRTYRLEPSEKEFTIKERYLCCYWLVASQFVYVANLFTDWRV